MREKRYGPVATMAVVGVSVGTFEPARLMVAIAEAKRTNANANTIAPNQAAGTRAGRKGRGLSQPRASPTTTAKGHALVGLTMTLAVSAASATAKSGAVRLYDEYLIIR